MNSEEGIKRLLEHKEKGFKYVSFDVFDTLLERCVSNPTDIHRLVGSNIFAQGDSYCNIRIDAEKLSRNEYGETTIDDIKKKLYHYLDKKIADQLIAKELELEKKILKPRIEGKKIYEKAKELNMTIIVISDMYLSSEFLQEVLCLNGYDNHIQLYVSGEYDAGKWNKKLYEIVLCDYKISNPEEMLHFGDNKHADCDMSSEVGVNSFYLPKEDRSKIVGELVTSIANVLEPCSIMHASKLKELYYQRKTKNNDVSFN